MAKQAARPRPNKNSDGTPKQPSMTRTITSSPAPPPKPLPAPPTPGQPAPGMVNPMTHPMHPQMQSQLGTAPKPPSPPGDNGQPQPAPGAGGQPANPNPNPTGSPLGNIIPTPSQDQRQVREQIAFKDMNPVEQSQTAMQQGLDPYAPLKMVQQGVEGALQGGPTNGPVPQMLAGPFVPPGVESFPDDMAHLQTLMQQGYAPGSSPQEHELAMNAHAVHNARLDQAMQQAQQGAGQPTPPAPFAPPPPGGAPQGVTLAPGIPQLPSAQGGGPNGVMNSGSAAGPPGLQAGLGTPPPPSLSPPPGGAVPPELLAALLAGAKRKAK